MNDHDPVEISKLSRRQSQVLDCLAAGMQYKQIAHKLKISENTVAYHVSELKRKLGCGSSREILIFALKYGLVDQSAIIP